MKRLLFIVSTLNTGGAQRIISNITMALPKDYEIDILLNDTENISYTYRGNMIDLGIAAKTDKKKIGYQMKVFGRRFKILKKMKRENRYDAYISAMDSANVLNAMIPETAGKTILTVHGYHKNGWLPAYIEPVVNWCIQMFYRKADCIVTVSDGLYREMLQKYKIPEEKLCTIYNGYRTEEILTGKNGEARGDFWQDETKKTVITSGRLVPVKGQWHLLRAFSAVLKKLPDTRLVFMGDGELKNRLSELADKLGIAENVIFLGFVKNPYAHLGKADVFALSSLSEGYPNAIAEAIICGVPCVSCDCEAGPREILAETSVRQCKDNSYVEAKYGILTPAFSDTEDYLDAEVTKEEAVMADAIVRLLTDGQLRESYLAAMKEKAKQLDMENIIEQWVELF